MSAERVVRLAVITVVAGSMFTQFTQDAQATTTVINDVNVNLGGTPTNIGTITVYINEPMRSRMEADFAVAANYQGSLCQQIHFHWVQIVMPFAGGYPPYQPGLVNPASPVVDPPAGGWDYMYRDLNCGGTEEDQCSSSMVLPCNGIQASERSAEPGHICTGYEVFVDADTGPGISIDTAPWYYSAVGEASYNVFCQTYHIGDTKGLRPPPGVTFKTWLVAETGANTFGLIRGFQWTVSTNDSTFDMALLPTQTDATKVSNALKNGKINGWTVNCGSDGTCIPTLSEWGLAILTLLVLTAATVVVMRRQAVTA